MIIKYQQPSPVQDFEVLHKYHIELWNYMAESGFIDKRFWAGWETREVRELGHKYPLLMVFDCFACAFRKSSASCEGKLCPIIWPHTKRNAQYSPCQSRNSVYQKWVMAITSKERRMYAKQIAELPWQYRYSWTKI